ncbi:ImmA/IrrE family metallo-endopeptidase [Campylobacter lari]|uniref:ImmA/IrrE family metallo-endopeptidase n=1 Tax=Campylobacter lari TaxID=201 RepID=UPI0021C14BE1|nr:ImmA/IrrE family metallo-endopeptidase [Campylobacter lari]
MAFIKTKQEKKYNDSYSKKNIQEIHKHAEQLGIETKPFDIFGYISHVKEIVYWEDYFDDDISGSIEYSLSGEYNIVVNKYHSLSRRRFTLAHEFGHFVLHKDVLKKEGKIEDYVLFRRKNNFSMIESEANYFAAELLMPKILFDEEIKKGNNDIKKLAEVFEVSYSAIQYRAFKLGYLKEF